MHLDTNQVKDSKQSQGNNLEYKKQTNKKPNKQQKTTTTKKQFLGILVILVPEKLKKKDGKETENRNVREEIIKLKNATCSITSVMQSAYESQPEMWTSLEKGKTGRQLKRE